ncbi:hypothetical protein [Paenibacillus macerans]|uniref:hypothetical protein n=1 Tax=Paenibacillus macerans TaxID=44252 RepID=UPI00203A5997|nr:hypothetical protein [Paenibacillus macerans]MCM3699194.1 hypothetical protein [Paenibacillus macerans]
MSEDLNKRNKQEWIESAAAVRAEPYEIAGALFDCTPDALLSQQEVQRRLDAYRRPAKQEQPATKQQVKKKEATENVD